MAIPIAIDNSVLMPKYVSAVGNGKILSNIKTNYSRLASSRFITEPAAKILVAGDYDVVAGGGPAGFAAAEIKALFAMLSYT